MLTEKEQKELEALVAKTNVQASAAGAKAQVETVMALFKANGGKVTGAQLLTINPKYPSDPIYYARKAGAVIRTERARAGKSVYVLQATAEEVARMNELKAKLNPTPAQVPPTTPAAPEKKETAPAK